MAQGKENHTEGMTGKLLNSRVRIRLRIQDHTRTTGVSWSAELGGAEAELEGAETRGEAEGALSGVMEENEGGGEEGDVGEAASATDSGEVKPLRAEEEMVPEEGFPLRCFLDDWEEADDDREIEGGDSAETGANTAEELATPPPEAEAAAAAAALT